ncbi:MAG: hypothetical protein BGO68_05960 [Candidatus Amoebophilus sp. 36-38]|nr:MAG: hypothetical protein BGO68_05960 [Candidatus Amoebophilus sp. 36-38]
MKFSKNMLTRYVSLVQLILFVTILHTGSCGCNKNKDLGRDDSLVMQVPSDPLIGDQKSVEVVFTLEEKNKTVVLDNFILQVSLEETGSSGNQISYKDSSGALQKSPGFNKSLTDFIPLDSLTSEQPTFKVLFELFPEETTTELKAKFVLSTKSGDMVSEGVVTWKSAPKAIDLSIRRTGPEAMEGKQKTISLEIENKGIEATKASQLKLKVTRDQGISAIIIGATQVDNTHVYLVDLPVVGANGKINWDLEIDPKTDPEISFSIQPQYAGKDIKAPITATWQKGVVLEISNIKYDQNTGKVYADIKNQGTKKARNIKLTYQVKTPGAQLESVDTREIILGELDKNGQIKNYELGKLEFGGTNKSAIFEFALSCEENSFRGAENVVKETFTKADIAISITINHDKNTGQISGKVKNIGKDVAEGLQLVYKNVSTDAGDKLVTLDNNQEKALPVGNLTLGQERSFNLNLDLKEAEAATFDFQVLYDNNPVSHTTETFQAKPIKLSLNVLTPVKDASENYILYDSENEIKFQILQELDSRTINPAYVSLDIQEASGIISKDKAINQVGISKLVGPELGKLGDEIRLYIHPTPGVKKAHFKLQLKYKDHLLGDPILIEWREYSLNIIGNDLRLVGEQEGSFSLESLTPIQLDALAVEIESENGTTFQFPKLDKNWTDGSVNLRDLAEYADLGKRQKTKDIKFKISQKNNQRKAKAKIIVKRGNVELTSKEIYWINEEIAVSITSDTSTPKDEVNIHLKNVGNSKIILSDIKVKVIATGKFSVTLGKVAGTSIDKSLAEITGQVQLEGKEEVVIPLKMNSPLGNEIMMGVILAFLEEEGPILDKKYFIFQDNWVSKEANRFLVTIGGSIEKFPSQFALSQNDPAQLKRLLQALRNLVKIFNMVIKKCDEILLQDSGFEHLLNDERLLYSNRINQLEKYIQDAEAAILALNKDETSIEAWAKATQAYKEKVQDAIQGILREITYFDSSPELDNIEQIRNLLVGDFTNKPLEQQSVRGAYDFYKQKVEACRDFLIQQGVTDFKPAKEDSPSIKKLKEIYKKMADGLPTILQQAQDNFDTGLEVVFENVTKKDEEAKNKQDAGALYNSLIEQISVLPSFEKLKKREDGLGIDLQVLNHWFAENYQRIAASGLELVKLDSKGSKPALELLARDAEISLQAAENAYQVAQATKDETTKQAAIKAREFAKQACEAAIDIYNKEKGDNKLEVYHLIKANHLIEAKKAELTSIKEIIDELNKRINSIPSLG